MDKIKNVFGITEENKAAGILNIPATLFALIILYGCPLFLPEGYFKLLLPKLTVFVTGTLMAFLICRIADRIFSLKTHEKPVLNKKNINSDVILLFILIIINLISAFFSEWKETAILGTDAKYMGLFTFLFILLAYITFSGYCRTSVLFVRVTGISTVLVVLWSYMQFIGIDVFGHLGQIKQSMVRNFISPLGNLLVYASYLCLLVPVYMYLYCFKEGDNFFELILCIAGFLGLFTTNSDGAYLGYGTAFIVLGIVSLKNGKTFRKFIELCIGFFVTAKFFYLFYRFANGSGRSVSTITKLFCFKNYSLIIIAVLTAVYIFIRIKPLSDKAGKIIKTVAVAGIAAGTAAFVIGMIYFTKIDTQRELGKLGEYLRFDYNWGTGRGFIWTYCFKIFANDSFIQKLFGTGGDTLGFIMERDYWEEMTSTAGCYFNNAHNEFLQYFVTYGLFGVSAYIAFIIVSIKNAVKKGGLINMAFVFGAVGYLAQSVVSLHQCITTPMFFLILALANSIEITAVSEN